MAIRQLPPVLVNRIAAGEVIERPAAAVKELVENAIDAGADAHRDRSLREGGQALIAVADDGCGMTRDELSLAVERHCTSKLPDDDLLEIAALGFRGEALPSIGAVSRLRIVSRPPGRRQRLGDRGRGRRQARAGAGGASAGHAGRGARPVFRHPGAAQIPEDAAQRARPGGRRGQAPGDGLSRHRLHGDRRRRARAAAPAGGRAARRRPARRGSRRCSAATSPRIRCRSTPSATASA